MTHVPDDARTQPTRIPRTLHLYAGNLYGGIERGLTDLAEWAADGSVLQCEFGLCFPGKLKTDLERVGVPVYDLGTVRFRQPWTVLRARHRVRALLARRRYDAVFVDSFWPHAVLAPAVKRAGLPLVLGVHDTPRGEHWIERLAFRTRPDVLRCNSKFTQHAAATLLPGVPSVVHYNLVAAPAEIDAPAVRAEVRASFGTDARATVIIMTARLEPYKGHVLLLQALGRLDRSTPWECWIAGGVQRPHEEIFLDRLRRDADALGISDRVRFIGQQSDVYRTLAAADVHCQPNLGPEPFGRTFVEALYAGLPVVTTDMAGGAEIVDPSCGILTPPGDVGALAGVLQDLLDDVSRRRRLGDAGPARAAELCDAGRGLKQLAAFVNDLRIGRGTRTRAAGTSDERRDA